MSSDISAPALDNGAHPGNTGETSRPICRVATLTGLAHRQMPSDCAVIPQPLTYWCAAVRPGETRAARHLPAIYLHHAAPQGARMIVPSPGNQNLVSACRHRLRVARRRNINTGDGVAEEQSALRPRHLHTLGHLVASLKYQHAGTTVVPDAALKDRPGMLMEPAPMVSRMGYSMSGDAYRYIEEDLRVLAQFLIVKEERIDEEWRTVTSEPILRYFDSGRVRVQDGIEQLNSGDIRRHNSWRMSFGKGFLSMLQAQPSDLSVISPALWKSAGRSPTSQWLALYLSGHGYGGADIYKHRLDTLIERMRLCPDEVMRHISQLDVNAQLASASGQRERSQHPSDKTARTEEAYWENLSQRERHVARLRQRLMQQISSAGTRIANRLGLAACSIVEQRADDLSRSQRRRQLSVSDLLNVRRWSADIEQIVLRIPSWITKHADLLAYADRASEALRSSVSAMLLRLEGTSSNSWVSRYVIGRLQLARAMSERHSRESFTHPVQLLSLGSPPQPLLTL